MYLYIASLILLSAGKAKGAPECGSTTSEESGTISSPNYPHLAPRDSNCTWLIQPKNGNWIQVNFTDVDIESDPSCYTGSVKLYDGNDRIVDIYCNSRKPSKPLATNNKAKVNFAIQGRIDGHGFVLKYGSYSCGGTLEVESGEIMSPNYPYNYPNSFECAWTIVRPADRRIRIDFIDFDVDGQGNCSTDSVKLFDVISGKEQLSGVYCGKLTPITFFSISNKLIVRFTTNRDTSKPGFKLQYSTVAPCGEQLSSESGTIESPYYPGQFPNDLYCTWTIQPPEKNWIQINFTSVDIKSDASCFRGSLKLYDGNDRIVGSYCSSRQPDRTLATNSKAKVIFAVEKVTGTGFSLNYKSYTCGGILRERSGEITSPNYPYNYPNNIECSWRIERQGHERIKIEFLALNVDYKENCAQDSVKLFDVINGKEQLSGVYCGTLTTTTAYSKGYIFVVKFTSNADTSKPGFRLRYSTVSVRDLPTNPFPPAFCNVTLTAASGMFESPNYPRTLPNRICVWKIERPEGEWIDFEFLDLDLDSQDCVMLGDDTQETGRFCGTQMPCKHLATRNKATVKLTTNPASAKRGLKIRYIAHESCNKQIFDISGEIRSPNYPNNYPRMDCTWKIITQPGKKVYVEFFDLDMGYDLANDGCRSNSLTLMDVVRGQRNIIGVFCGNTIPAPTVSAGNELWIKFSSSKYMQKRGFSLKYTTDLRPSLVISPVRPIRPFIGR